jgi:hypothetical protein
MLLQAMMCRVRLNAYPLLVDSVQIDGTRATLGISETNEKDPQQRLYPFPVQLTTKPELLDALLLHSASTEAMLYLHGVAKELFGGR